MLLSSSTNFRLCAGFGVPSYREMSLCICDGIYSSVIDAVFMNFDPITIADVLWNPIFSNSSLYRLALPPYFSSKSRVDNFVSYFHELETIQEEDMVLFV